MGSTNGRSIGFQSNQATENKHPWNPIKMHLRLTLFLALPGFLIFLGGNTAHSDEGLPKNVRPVKKYWESAWPAEEIPANIASMNAASCGACHSEIYREWQTTTHAKAFTDLQFQGESKKENLSMCINCHSPLQNQQRFQVLGFIDGDYRKPFKRLNPAFDSSLEQEGITCAVCHVRDGMIVGPRGTGLAPHPVRKDSTYFMNLCMQCHNAQDVVSKTLVCSFNTGDNWRSGPYAKQKKNCIDCHMPTTPRALALGGKIYPDSHMHTWPGMGISKFISDLAAVSAKYVPGLKTEIRMDTSVRSGETHEFGVVLTNQKAGHEIPTGDPERFVRIDLQILEPQGKVLAEKVERIGETWQWYPEAKKLADNSLQIKEKRFIGVRFTPANPIKGMMFRVEVSNHRITEANAASLKLGKEYPRDLTVFKDTKSFSVR